MRHGEHVGEVRRPYMAAFEILEFADGLDDVFGDLPVLEQCLRNAHMPIAHDGFVGRSIGKQCGVLVGPGQNVELTDTVQQAGEQRGIRIDLRHPSRHHVRHGRHCRAALPQRRHRRFQSFQVVRLSHLRHGKGD